MGLRFISPVVHCNHLRVMGQVRGIMSCDILTVKAIKPRNQPTVAMNSIALVMLLLTIRLAWAWIMCAFSYTR